MLEHLPRAPRRLTGASPSIGLLLDVLDDSPYQWSILRGAMDAAYQRGAHLICFAGGVLGAPLGEGGERNSVYDLARGKNVDALVLLSGAIGRVVGTKGLEEYSERFRPLPVCSIALAMAGASSVCIDNQGGMRSALEHVIDVHGKKGIAFVRGPAGNAEAEERYRVFVDILGARSLPFRADHVFLGDFALASGSRAVEAIFGERKGAAPIDAIVAANDIMALGVLEELARRKIRVPEEVAVVGFDDIEEARVTMPPLTTVRQPIYDLGRDAVRLVCEQLERSRPPERLVRTTELVARRSCGCTRGRPLSVRASEAPGASHQSFAAALLGRRQSVLTEMHRAARGQLGAAGAGWDERLLSAFAEQVTGDSSDAFGRAYDDILRRLSADDVDITLCNDVISAMRAQSLRFFANEPTRRLQAENLFHEARVMTAHFIDRVQSSRRMRAWRGARALGRASAAIAAGADMEALSKASREHLPALGIPRCYVLENCGRSGEIRMVRLVLALRPDARGSDPLLARPAPLTDILRTEVLPKTSEHAFVVLPLGTPGKDTGFLVLELGASDGYLYETLREVFSAALSGRRATREGENSA